MKYNRTVLGVLAIALLAGSALVTALPQTLANHLQCSDGVDNDSDSLADFPHDPDCSSPEDNTESGSATASSASSHSSVMSSSESSAGTITLSVTDDRVSIRPGDSMTYAVTVQQNTDATRDVDVELTLPAQAESISADRGGTVAGTRVRWQHVQLTRGQPQRLTAQVGVSNRAPEGLQFIARVTAAGVSASDTTLISTNPQQQTQGAFQLVLTDGVQTVEPNGRLTYTLTVTNTQTAAQTADVVLTLPQYFSPQQITPETTNAGNILTWKTVALNPGETRTYTVAGMISRSVPQGAQLTAQARSGTAGVSDTTTVQTGAAASSRASSASSRASSAAVQSGSRSVFFTKTADKDEVMPGGIVRYTLYVQNVLLNTIDDAVITDRFDAAVVSVSDLGGGTLVRPGELQWRVPRLLPGQVWQQTYALTVSPQAPNGTQLSNVASISGTDVAYASLEEKVAVISTGVVGRLPSTGAPMDIVFVTMTLPLAAAGAALQRRLRNR